MSVVHASERDQLELLDRLIEEWKNLLLQEAECVDREQVAALIDTAKKFAHRLDDNLPPSLSPTAVAEVRRIILGAYRVLDETDPDRPLDLLDDLMVRAESIRHVVRDALDEQLEGDPRTTPELLGFLALWLPRITQKRIANLVGVNARTWYRWKSEPPTEASRRLILVVWLVNLLRHAWTPEGIVAWFYRERRDLDDRRPIDVLDDPEYENRLMLAARQGRAQHGG